jgi:GDP-L-fucose synthase
MSKIILVTGGSSFLGHHVVPLLKKYAREVNPLSKHIAYLKEPRFKLLTPSSKELNLLSYESVLKYLQQHRPNIILHMAALCGGIGANKDNPAIFIHENLKMTINLFEGIRTINTWQNNTIKQINCERPITHLYGVGSICEYPEICPVPFKETDLWNGFEEPTNAGYGESKRVMLLMQQCFRDQFGLKGMHFLPVNMYGNYDNFDYRNGHVIPALIRKFLDSKNNNLSEVEIWGDGTPTREFFYAKDCAEAICKAVVEEVDYNDPVNLGTGVDISIKDLAELIAELVNYSGKIVFNGKIDMNGQPIRRLDVSRAQEVLGFKANTSLRDGLIKTIEWVIDNDIFNYKKNNVTILPLYNMLNPPICFNTDINIKTDNKNLINKVNNLKNSNKEIITKGKDNIQKFINSIQRQLGYIPEVLKEDFKINQEVINLKNIKNIKIQEYKKNPVEDFKNACEYYEKEFGINPKDNNISETEIMFVYILKDINFESSVKITDIYNFCNKKFRKYTKFLLDLL